MPKNKFMGFYVVQVVHQPNEHEIFELTFQWVKIAELYNLAFDKHVRIEVETYSFAPGEYHRVVVSKQLLDAAKLKPSTERVVMVSHLLEALNAQQ